MSLSATSVRVPLLSKLIAEHETWESFREIVTGEPQQLSVQTNDTLPYSIIRQNKRSSNMDDPLVRECRSLVVQKSPLRLVAYSPGKSEELGDDVDWASLTQSEFIDGTMINVFWEGGEQWIATRSFLGATCRQQSEKTFATMFAEAQTEMGLNLEEVAGTGGYSLTFILTHPENRIVKAHDRPGLVLVSAARVTDAGVEIQRPSEFKRAFRLSCHVPHEQTFMDLERMTAWVGERPPHFQGVMLVSPEGRRQKVRNPFQNLVRRLRGNNRRADWRQVELMKEGALKKYLRYYGEESDTMWECKRRLDRLVMGVFHAQITVFVRRAARIPEVDFEQRPVIVELNTKQHESLKPEGRVVTPAVVRAHILAMPVKRVLFLMNQKQRPVDAEEEGPEEEDAPFDDLPLQELAHA